jgi:ABC-2 type transport system permease protein
MRAVDLALKDLSQILRDREAALFLVIMPIVFTVLFGFAFGGFGGDQEDPRLPVGFVAQDGGSILSTGLLDLLAASSAVRPVEDGGEDLDAVAAMVADAEWAAAVIVPADYGELLLGVAEPLTIIADQGAPAGLTASREIQAAATRVAGAVRTARLSVEAYEAQAEFADESARQAFAEEALGLALAAWEDPPVTVAATQSGGAEDEEANPSGFAHYSVGILVQFSMAGLMGSAGVMVRERKSRALQRLLTTAIYRLEIVLGHYLAMVLMILLQLVVLVGFGQLVLDVGYLREPGATLLMMVVLSVWSGAAGLLIGVLAKTQEQIIIFCLIPMLLLAGLGGAWLPLEYTSQTFQTVGHFTPLAWAMDGFESIVLRGLGAESVLLPAVVLLAYAILIFGLALWRFRFE